MDWPGTNCSRIRENSDEVTGCSPNSHEFAYIFGCPRIRLHFRQMATALDVPSRSRHTPPPGGWSQQKTGKMPRRGNMGDLRSSVQLPFLVLLVWGVAGC